MTEKNLLESSDAKQEREKYIAGLEKVVLTIDEILQEENMRTVFSEEEFTKLRKLKADAEEHIQAMKENAFTVAVVGMTSNGKSVATNTIVIGKNILPTSTDECTKTSTEIRYTNEQHYAEIFYLTYQEFYQKFIKILTSIPDLPDDLLSQAKMIQYDTRDGYLDFQREYDRWYNFNLENGITAISKGSQEINLRLQHLSKIFNYLSDQNRKDRLDNATSESLKEYVANDAVSPAVKQVVIYSPNLDIMSNAIFKDMPGLGTKNQSFYSLSAKEVDKADAVLLLRRFDEIERDHCFDDLLKEIWRAPGNNTFEKKRQIAEKLFLFVNFADVQIPEEDMKNRREKHIKAVEEGFGRNDTIRQLIDKNMVIGSALAFAPEDGLTAKELAMREEAITGLQKNGFYMDETHATCIDSIRKKLQKFNDTKRLAIRIQRAKEIQTELASLLDRYQGEFSKTADFDHEIFKNKLRKNLISFEMETQEMYDENNAVSKAKEFVKAGIDQLKHAHFENLSEDPDWKKAADREDFSIYQSVLPKDYYFRSKKYDVLHHAYLKGISAVNTAAAAGGYFNPQKILPKVQKIIVNAMGVDENGQDYQALYDRVGEFLDSKNDPIFNAVHGLKPNAGVFEDDLFILLLATPFLSEERWDYFNNPTIRQQIERLDQAYAESFPEKGIQPLISQILFHKYRRDIMDSCYAEGYKAICIEKISDEAKSSSILEEIEPEIEKVCVRLSEKRLRRPEEDIDFPDFRGKNADEIVQLLKKVVEDTVPVSYTSKDYDYGRQVMRRLREKTKDETLGKTEQMVMDEFNQDVAILIDALENALSHLMHHDQECYNATIGISEHIRKEYAASLAEWIRGDEQIKAWIARSVNPAEKIRNDALHQIGECSFKLNQWIS